MLDLNEVKNQTHINSDEVTREEAAEISSAEKWAPHLSDGLDAFERAIFKVEHQKWMQVLAKAWSDETFKERLMRLHAPSALKDGSALRSESQPSISFNSCCCRTSNATSAANIVPRLSRARRCVATSSKVWWRMSAAVRRRSAACRWELVWRRAADCARNYRRGRWASSEHLRGSTASTTRAA